MKKNRATADSKVSKLKKNALEVPQFFFLGGGERYEENFTYQTAHRFSIDWQFWIIEALQVHEFCFHPPPRLMEFRMIHLKRPFFPRFEKFNFPQFHSRGAFVWGWQKKIIFHLFWPVKFYNTNILSRFL